MQMWLYVQLIWITLAGAVVLFGLNVEFFYFFLQQDETVFWALVKESIVRSFYECY